jgi:hypothetical protein
VDVVSADLVPDGGALWLRWTEGIRMYALATGRWPPGPTGPERFTVNARYIDMLRTDAGSALGFARVVARRRQSA